MSSNSSTSSCFANETLRDPVFGPCDPVLVRSSGVNQPLRKRARLMLFGFVTAIEIVGTRGGSAGFKMSFVTRRDPGSCVPAVARPMVLRRETRKVIQNIRRRF